jgi:hypothetical protein
MALSLATRFNRFGASWTEVAPVLGAAADDLATPSMTVQEAIEAALDRATALVVGSAAAVVRQWIDEQPPPVTIPSLAQVVVIGAAAELGGRLYASGQDQWSVVTDLAARFQAVVNALAAGTFRPAEMPVDFGQRRGTAGGIGTFCLMRG